jgi:hypothetical protein
MCETLDANVTSQLYKVGGANYTTIASLAWRSVREGERVKGKREREREKNGREGGGESEGKREKERKEGERERCVASSPDHTLLRFQCYCFSVLFQASGRSNRYRME